MGACAGRALSVHMGVGDISEFFWSSWLSIYLCMEDMNDFESIIAKSTVFVFSVDRDGWLNQDRGV